MFKKSCMVTQQPYDACRCKIIFVYFVSYMAHLSLSSSVLLYVHRDNIKEFRGRGAQDGHLNIHTATEL